MSAFPRTGQTLASKRLVGNIAETAEGSQQVGPPSLAWSGRRPVAGKRTVQSNCPLRPLCTALTVHPRLEAHRRVPRTSACTAKPDVYRSALGGQGRERSTALTAARPARLSQRRETTDATSNDAGLRKRALIAPPCTPIAPGSRRSS